MNQVREGDAPQDHRRHANHRGGANGEPASAIDHAAHGMISTTAGRVRVSAVPAGRVRLNRIRAASSQCPRLGPPSRIGGGSSVTADSLRSHNILRRRGEPNKRAARPHHRARRGWPPGTG